MRAMYSGSSAGTTREGGQVLLGGDIASEAKQNQRDESAKRVRPVTRINGNRIYFRDLAAMAFPTKTDANLAFYAGVDARTARRWLSEGSDPPADVLGIILAEIMRRYGQR